MCSEDLICLTDGTQGIQSCMMLNINLGLDRLWILGRGQGVRWRILSVCCRKAKSSWLLMGGAQWEGTPAARLREALKQSSALWIMPWPARSSVSFYAHSVCGLTQRNRIVSRRGRKSRSARDWRWWGVNAYRGDFGVLLIGGKIGAWPDLTRRAVKDCHSTRSLGGWRKPVPHFNTAVSGSE